MGQIQAAITAGVYRRADYFQGGGAATTDTFADYADAWLATMTLERSSYRGYKASINATWKPAFEGMRLVQIRYSDVKRAIADKRKVASAKTLNNGLICLRGIFDTAVRDGLIPKSPVDGIENQKHQAAPCDPFERAEMEAVLSHMADRYHAQVWHYFTFAFHTGMRPSELIALQWGDVDWRASTIRVQRARVDWEEKGTKTNTVRDVDLSEAALDALRRQKVHTFMLGPEAAIFANPNTGAAWSDEQVQRRLYYTPTLRALGLRHRDMYQTRHTFATLLLMGGINPAYIARQLGHTNAQMLFKVYAKWIDGADKGAEAAKARAVLSSNCPRGEAKG
jgi:integrase